MPTANRHRSEVLTVYVAGLFQGLALVAFPAAATLFQSSTGYDLSSSEYGTLFVPQVVLAIASSLALPRLADRFGLKAMLSVGLVADVVAMALLLASTGLEGETAAFPVLLLATASLGLGFGTTLSCLSTYAGGFLPDRREVALTSLNVLLGLGTALSPVLIALFTDLAEWWYLPLVTGVGLVAVLVAVRLQPMEVAEAAPVPGDRPARRPLPPTFWIFAGALVAYGVIETMFGNWGTTLLTDAGASASAASYGLASFWACVTIGRLVIALVSAKVGSTRIYLVLPVAMALVLALAAAAPELNGIVLFGLAGFACSGFFPMTIGYGETTFPDHVEVAAGWLVAAYQLGYGIAAFGAGALQSAIELSTVFWLAVVLAVVMAVLAVSVVRLQTRALPADH